MNPVTAFVLGFFLGAWFGMILIAILTVSKWGEEVMKGMGREE